MRTSSTYTVAITADDIEDLGGFEFDLSFDPNHLRIDDIALGDMLGSTGRSASKLGPSIDNTAGTATFGAFSFGSQSGPGSGALAILTFTTLSTPGASQLELQDVQILNTQAQSQPAQATSGGIVLSGTPLTVTRVITGDGLYTFDDACAQLQVIYTGEASAVTVTLVYRYPTPLSNRPLPRKYAITANGTGFAALLSLCYQDAEWQTTASPRKTTCSSIATPAKAAGAPSRRLSTRSTTW